MALTEQYFQWEAESHCDIFRQGGVEMIDRANKKTLSQKKPFQQTKIADEGLDGRIRAGRFREFCG